MALDALNAWRVAAVAVVAGASVGAAATVLQRSTPWTVGDVRVIAAASGPAPRAETSESRFAFGTVGTGHSGSHDFEIRNAGDQPLTLRKGATSCSCTVSEFEATEGGSPDGSLVVPPGERTTVRVKWKGKPPGGPFRQQVTVLTDDPRRPEMVFVIEGMVVPTWKAKPEVLSLARVTASTGGTAVADVYTYGTEPATVTGIELGEGSRMADHLTLATEPMSEADRSAEHGATGGFRVVVTVKPGAPIGTLRDTVKVLFAMPEAVEAELGIDGTVVGDLAMAGPGWDSSQQALRLGTVSGKTGLRTRVFLTAKGPHREAVRPTVREVVPDSLEVTVGEGAAIGSGGAMRIPIDIVIPPGSRAVNHLCSQQGPAGRIVLDTGHPDSPTFTIPVCVAIGP